MTGDRHLHTVSTKPANVTPLVKQNVDDDSVRWLVGVMVELSRRFIGHAIKRYPEFESNRHRCSKCGERG